MIDKNGPPFIFTASQGVQVEALAFDYLSYVEFSYLAPPCYARAEVTLLLLSRVGRTKKHADPIGQAPLLGFEPKLPCSPTSPDADDQS